MNSSIKEKNRDPLVERENPTLHVIPIAHRTYRSNDDSERAQESLQRQAVKEGYG